MTYREQFEKQGYFTVKGFLSEEETAQALAEVIGEAEDAEPLPNPEERNFFGVFTTPSVKGYNLDHPGLNAIGNKPELWAIMRELLGDECVSNGRFMQVYQKRHMQSWHQDSDADDLPFFFINCFPYLQDQAVERGQTRIVPGSHLTKIEKRFPDQAILPGQLALEVPAGTLCVCSSLTWHSASENYSDEPRLLVNYRFTQKEFEPAAAKPLYGRARHARGYRRFGQPILDRPNDIGCYEWTESYKEDEFPWLTKPGENQTSSPGNC